MGELSRHLEFIRTYLPKYLSPEQQENLFSCIKEDFPYSTNPSKIYFKLDNISVFYQGDVIIDIPFAQWDSKSSSFVTKYYTAAIISNTCDIKPENERIQDPNVTLAAVFSLAKYVELLKKRNISMGRINSFLDSLKKNRISNLFYLAEVRQNSQIILEESLIRFDFTASIPISLLNSEAYNRDYFPNGDRKVTFSDYGFYLFLFKLSVHYCRFREGVFRSS
ncbi:MAG: hypothetical protein ACE5JB_05745 [bacterium]